MNAVAIHRRRIAAAFIKAWVVHYGKTFEMFLLNIQTY